MKYRVMFLVSKRDNYESLYKFDITTIDNNIQYKEFDTLEQADDYVEFLLNNSKYSKDEILVVQIKDYDIFTNIHNTISVVSDKIIPRKMIYYNKDEDNFYLHVYDT